MKSLQFWASLPIVIKHMRVVAQIPSLPELEVLANLFNAPISMLISHDEQPDASPEMDAVQAQKFMQLRQRIIATRLRKATG